MEKTGSLQLRSAVSQSTRKWGGGDFRMQRGGVGVSIAFFPGAQGSGQAKHHHALNDNIWIFLELSFKSLFFLIFITGQRKSLTLTKTCSNHLLACMWPTLPYFSELLVSQFSFAIFSIWQLCGETVQEFTM